MLRDRVVEAVAQGLFHVYPVKTVDEAMELLTGLPVSPRAFSPPCASFRAVGWP